MRSLHNPFCVLRRFAPVFSNHLFNDQWKKPSPFSRVTALISSIQQLTEKPTHAFELDPLRIVQASSQHKDLSSQHKETGFQKSEVDPGRASVPTLTADSYPPLIQEISGQQRRRAGKPEWWSIWIVIRYCYEYAIIYLLPEVITLFKLLDKPALFAGWVEIRMIGPERDRIHSSWSPA